MFLHYYGKVIMWKIKLIMLHRVKMHADLIGSFISERSFNLASMGLILQVPLKQSSLLF